MTHCACRRLHGSARRGRKTGARTLTVSAPRRGRSGGAGAAEDAATASVLADLSAAAFMGCAVE